MSEPFIGQIILVGFNFAPRGWAFCQGQLLSIAQNTALFSLLGTTYGGNGQTTFALPDLRGRVPIGFGQGPGLQNYVLGQTGGQETHTLISNEMPSHNHGLGANSNDAVDSNPVNNFPAAQGAYANTANGQMSPTQLTGGSQPHNNLQPYLVLNYCIALVGIFPSRN
jgi:microcystin-dependent protein